MPDARKPGGTRPLDGTPQTDTTQKPEIVQLTDAPPSSWSVRLIAADHAIPIQLRVDSRAIIGRSDPDSGYLPEIDLNPYDALERGVSRRHAEIRAGEDYLVIIDRNSTNGTQLNGFALQANEPYRLKHGDQLTVGMMNLNVFISIMPLHAGVKRVRRNIGRLGKDDPSEKDYTVRRVLVADDVQDDAHSLASMISSVGYETHITHSLGEAMRFIAHEVPDCVLVNMDMDDDKPAPEISRLIKQDLAKDYVPVFIMSDKPNEDRIREAFEAGADIFLSKPLGYDELINGLQEYVGDPKIRPN